MPDGRGEHEPEWNGEPCAARRVTVVVADAPEFQAYWARPLIGQERQAVEIIYEGRTFYIDNEGDKGWYKVANGGSPRTGHRNLSVSRVLDTCHTEASMAISGGKCYACGEQAAA